MATHIRCYRCRCFFDIKLIDCPECGTRRHGYSSHLYTAALNSHLWKQAESADAQNKLVANMRAGREPDPPKWAKKAAKKIVADL